MEYSSDIIWRVWSKGEIFSGNDPVFWRRDEFGAWIFRSHYERKDSEYGWIIDHVKPLSEGGTDDISNLRPMQWDNTMRKTDGSIECHVTSTGIHNDKPIENKIIKYSDLNVSYSYS
jgi:hypothetical protein